MLIHVVTFTFKPSISTSEIDEFQKDFRFFVDQIPYARNVRHGIDLERDRTTPAMHWLPISRTKPCPSVNPGSGPNS